MFNIVLFSPKMPANVGNIIRLCANLGADLHIIRPIPFTWDEKKLRRAGLDYHEYTTVSFYDDFEHFQREHPNARTFLITTKGTSYYSQMQFQKNDFFIFGSETAGAPSYVHEAVQYRIRIPMLETSRSMNLSNTVAIILTEAMRQLDFPNCI